MNYNMNNFNENDIFKGQTRGYLICENAEEPMEPVIVGERKQASPKTGSSDRGVIIETILQTANKPNRNKRIYSKEALQFGLNTAYIQERLSTFTWYGELFHPVKPDPKRQMNYEAGNLSHIIESVWWEGDVLFGKVHSTFTQCGDDWAGLVKQGCQVAFSMRGIGPVVEKKDAITYVKPPLYIFCYDTVVHPSHPEAYMTKIIKEDSSFENAMNESTESLFYEIKNESVDEMLKEESKNYRYISSLFNIEDNKPIYITKNKKFVVKGLNESTDKVAIKIEDFLSGEVDRIMRGIE